MAGEDKLPDVLIAGAPKCGSSSVYYWLCAHPAICGSKHKEPHILRDTINRFNKEGNFQTHGLSPYDYEFGHCDPSLLKLEATPSYLYDRTPIDVLSEKPPLKIFFLLREPTERLHSQYRFTLYRRKQHRLDFKDFIDPQREMKGLHPLEKSSYAKYLRKWKEAFDPSVLSVHLFESLKEDPRGMMKGIANEIGIDPTFYDHYSFSARNPTKKIKNKRLHTFGESIQPFIPKGVQEKLHKIYLKFNSSELPPVSEEEKKEKERIRGSFDQEIQELGELFPDLDLTPWMRTREASKE